MLAKSFARIHMANLINWGILPLTFVNPADHDKTDQGDQLELSGAHNFVRSMETATIEDRTKGIGIPVRLTATRREREILLAGGRLSLAKRQGVGAAR